VQILRAVAALLVVAWHSPLVIKNFDGCYWGVAENGQPYCAQSFGFLVNHLNLGVDLFFCISGFIMCMVLRDVKAGVASARNFLLRRIIRIFPAYWVFSVVVVSCFYLSQGKLNMGNLGAGLVPDAIRIASSLLLLPTGESPVLIVGWTLVYEIQFYVACAVMLLVAPGKRATNMLLIFSAFFLAAHFLAPRGVLQYTPSLFSLEFLSGALAYRFRAVNVQRFSLFWIASSVMLFSGLSYWLDIRRASVASSFDGLLSVVASSVIGFMLIVACISCERAGGFESACARMMARIGDASYVLYLSHWLVLSFLGKMFSVFSAAPIPVIVVFHALGVAVSVVVAVQLSERYERRVHDFFIKSSGLVSVQG
jgi:peptidoglycan/LPS O-acetylase OafA/YrhL